MGKQILTHPVVPPKKRKHSSWGETLHNQFVETQIQPNKEVLVQFRLGYTTEQNKIY